MDLDAYFHKLKLYTEDPRERDREKKDENKRADGNT